MPVLRLMEHEEKSFSSVLMKKKTDLHFERKCDFFTKLLGEKRVER